MAKKQSITRKITQIAVFTAVSYVIYMFIKFPLPFIFPFWLEIHISDMPAILAGFMMGPIEGIAVLALRTLLKLPFSSTALIGELADLIMGIAFVLPSSLIYKYNRTKKGAVISLIVGCLCTTVTAMLVNYFVLVPFYVKAFFGGEIQTLVNALSVLFKNVNTQNVYAYYIFLSAMPFNLLRAVLSAIVTFLLYKRLVKLFDRIFASAKKAEQKEQEKGAESEKDDNIA